MNDKSITVIIAAKNEQERIGEVLKTVCSHPKLKDVIVVNDGSSDKTGEAAAKFPVTVINKPINQGKTLAVKDGLAKAKGEYILLVDADLVGLSHNDLDMLMRPVLDGKADCTLSLRGNSIPLFKLVKCEFITGERFLKKKYLEDPFIWARPKIGYGLEVRMNATLLKKKARFCTVYLRDMGITYKADKTGLLDGFKREFNMWFVQLPKALSFWQVVVQYLRMAFPPTYEKLYKK